MKIIKSSKPAFLFPLTLFACIGGVSVAAIPTLGNNNKTISGYSINEVGDFPGGLPSPDVVLTERIKDKLIRNEISVYSSESGQLWKNYCKEIANKIGQNWKHSTYDPWYRIIIKFGIQKDGSLGEIKIIESSDKKLIDQEAIAALRKTAPFAKLPGTIENRQFEPEVLFVHTVFEKHKHKLSNIDRGIKSCNSGNPVWDKYMTAVTQKISENWDPPELDHSCSSTVQFEICKNGSIAYTKISKSSGSPLMDQAAQKAVKKAAPFAKWPTHPKDNKVEVQIQLDYKVHSKHKKS